MLTRNRQALLWALMFPVIFTFVFGFFFGKNSTTGNIILINNSKTTVAQTLVSSLNSTNLFKIHTDVTDINTARDQVKKSKVAAVLIIPADFGAMTADSPKTLEVIDDPANATTNTILLGFLDKFNTNLTYSENKITAPAFAIDEEKTNTKTLNYFDFVLAGILGLALMNSSIVGIAVSMSQYRQDQILKRITTTPVKTWKFITAEVLSRLVVNFFQVSIILLIGKYIFDAHIYGNIFYIYALAMLGGLLFQLLGFTVASLVKSTDAAQGAAMVITIPMMFLGGVFFPIDSLPHWLFSFVQYLPIAPLLRALRGVVLQGDSPFANSMNIVVVLIWIVVCLGVATWRFRLSDE